MLIMPSVTMKDGTRQRSVTKPLMKPQPAPTARQATTVSGMETSGSSPKPPKPVITVGAMIAAPMTVVSARTEPTERSMPPMQDDEGHAHREDRVDARSGPG